MDWKTLRREPLSTQIAKNGDITYEAWSERVIGGFCSARCARSLTVIYSPEAS